MQPSLVRDLRGRRIGIKEEWRRLLRAEPVATPLANPDALDHLIDCTLDEIFEELGQARPMRDEPTTSYTEIRAECGCGRNPLLNYFLAGERALMDAMIWVQAAHPNDSVVTRRTEFAELYLLLRRIARREVRLFCSICQLPGATHGASHRTASPAHSSSMTIAKTAFAAASAAALVCISPVRAADGPAVYAQNCAACHGQDGAGHTRAGRMLGAKDLTSADYQKSFSDEDALKSLKEGYTVDGKQKMKPFADKLSDEDLKAAIAYVRTLKK